MSSRRKFITQTIKATSVVAAALTSKTSLANAAGDKPVVISTWRHGIAANAEAWKILDKGGRAVDAVEAGVRIPEADPEVTSVGYGGYPDAEGKLTLDACIMDEFGNAGSVAYIEHIMHPISVARKVMDETEHVMLVGEGAFKFAMKQGFKEENLVSPKAKEAWNQYKRDSIKNAIPAMENHDTIGTLALDHLGNLGGACTTSGLAWKMDGRVGDSPLIGAGLYVDNAIGAAAATGRGESVIKEAGSFLVVEFMRQGLSPQKACEAAVKRIAEKQKDWKDFQVAFIALNKRGETGAFALHQGANYALKTPEKEDFIDTNHL